MAHSLGLAPNALSALDCDYAKAMSVTNVVRKERWLLLDALRGGAALSIVFWHWQNFWLTTYDKKNDFPLYVIFRPFYDYGWIAVDLFFLLSGFIFFWKYEESIQRSTIGAWQFFLLRFARLYPLYFGTLLLMAALQMSYIAVGQPFRSPHDDAKHFILNLFMLSGWGFEDGFSFNMPAWSISIEVMLYICFFVLARAQLTRTWQLILLVGGAIYFSATTGHNIARGVSGFFVGGLIYRTVSLQIASRLLWVGLAAILIGVTAMTISRGTKWFVIAADLSAFPGIIFVLALLEGQLNGRWLAWLGSISYSSYLLHFPLQIAALLIVAIIGWKPEELFRSPLSLAAFFVVLMGIAWITYERFERPTQRRILSARRRIADAFTH